MTACNTLWICFLIVCSQLRVHADDHELDHEECTSLIANSGACLSKTYQYCVNAAFYDESLCNAVLYCCYEDTRGYGNVNAPPSRTPISTINPWTTTTTLYPNIPYAPPEPQNTLYPTPEPTPRPTPRPTAISGIPIVANTPTSEPTPPPTARPLFMPDIATVHKVEHISREQTHGNMTSQTITPDSPLSKHYELTVPITAPILIIVILVALTLLVCLLWPWVIIYEMNKKIKIYRLRSNDPARVPRTNTMQSKTIQNHDCV